MAEFYDLHAYYEDGGEAQALNWSAFIDSGKDRAIIALLAKIMDLLSAGVEYHEITIRLHIINPSK